MELRWVKELEHLFKEMQKELTWRKESSKNIVSISRNT